MSAETISFPGLLHQQLPLARLTAGANGEELACEMVEVERQVRHRHDDPRWRE